MAAEILWYPFWRFYCSTFGAGPLWECPSALTDEARKRKQKNKNREVDNSGNGVPTLVIMPQSMVISGNQEGFPEILAGISVDRNQTVYSTVVIDESSPVMTGGHREALVISGNGGKE